MAPPGASGVASAATTATVMLRVRQAEPVRYRVDMVGSPVPLAGGLPALIQQRLPHPPVGIARPGGPMCTGFRLATAACLPMSARTWGKQPPPAMPAHPVGGGQRECLHPSAWPNEGWCCPVTLRRPSPRREANGGTTPAIAAGVPQARGGCRGQHSRRRSAWARCLMPLSRAGGCTRQAAHRRARAPSDPAARAPCTPIPAALRPVGHAPGAPVLRSAPWTTVRLCDSS